MSMIAELMGKTVLAVPSVSGWEPITGKLVAIEGDWIKLNNVEIDGKMRGFSTWMNLNHILTLTEVKDTQIK